jgi:hypothetical protein
LDVIGFLSDLVSLGLDDAIKKRTPNFSDLVWDHATNGFELAVECVIPDSKRQQLATLRYDTIRYEVAVELDTSTSEIVIRSERGWLKISENSKTEEKLLFPLPTTPPSTLVTHKSKNARALFTKNPGGNDNYYAEAHEREGRWAPAFKLGPRKSTLANLPEDETNFPVSSWFKQLLSDGVEQIVLNSRQMRLASPPGQGSGFKPDGSNLPWVIAYLEQNRPDLLRDWVDHLRTALPDLEHFRTILREDDRHRYLVLDYKQGLDVPSWMASDGTLRLLALTLPAYLDSFRGIYLIEEPENGIHPRAIETMHQSLSSVFDAQILMATHSPVILTIADAEDVLCFAKSENGATDIVSGDHHPRLRDWRHEVDLGTLFASGVLG